MFAYIDIISTRKVRAEDGTLFLDMKCGNLLRQSVTRIQTDQVSANRAPLSGQAAGGSPAETCERVLISQFLSLSLFAFRPTKSPD